MSFDKLTDSFRNKGYNLKVAYVDVSLVVKSGSRFKLTDVMFHDGEDGMGYSKHPDEQWPVDSGEKIFINFMSRGDVVIIPMQSYFDDDGLARTDEMKAMQTSPSSIQNMIFSKAQSVLDFKLGYNCSDTPTATNLKSISAGNAQQMNDYSENTTNRTTFAGRPPLIANYDNKLKIQAGSNARVSGVLYYNDGLAR